MQGGVKTHSQLQELPWSEQKTGGGCRGEKVSASGGVGGSGGEEWRGGNRNGDGASPRRPKPAAIPPKTLRTTHSRSSVSSSRSASARSTSNATAALALAVALSPVLLEYQAPEDELGSQFDFACGMSESALGLGASGRHIDKQKRRKSLVREE